MTPEEIAARTHLAEQSNLALTTAANNPDDQEHSANEHSDADKPNDDDQMLSQLSANINDQDWHRIFRQLARSGTVGAAALLLRYRFGSKRSRR